MDWKNTLNDLAAAGLNTEEIADAVNRGFGAQVTTKSSISRLRTGETVEPRWSVGEVLRGLHKQHCKGVRPGRERAAA